MKVLEKHQKIQLIDAQNCWAKKNFLGYFVFSWYLPNSANYNVLKKKCFKAVGLMVQHS